MFRLNPPESNLETLDQGVKVAGWCWPINYHQDRAFIALSWKSQAPSTRRTHRSTKTSTTAVSSPPIKSFPCRCWREEQATIPMRFQRSTKSWHIRARRHRSITMASIGIMTIIALSNGIASIECPKTWLTRHRSYTPLLILKDSQTKNRSSWRCRLWTLRCRNYPAVKWTNSSWISVHRCTLTSHPQQD